MLRRLGKNLYTLAQCDAKIGPRLGSMSDWGIGRFGASGKEPDSTGRPALRAESARLDAGSVLDEPNPTDVQSRVPCGMEAESMLTRAFFLVALVVFWTTVVRGQTMPPAVPPASPSAAPAGSVWRSAAEQPSARTGPQAPGTVRPVAAEAPVAPDAPGAGVRDASPSGGAGPLTGVEPSAASAAPLATGPIAPSAADLSRRPIARVISGGNTLPADRGQVWREYDISPYTMRVTATERPEQGIIDWILRETGYEAWHGDTVAVLSASKRSLRVYHTPQMQAVVADVVDRFVASEAESVGFSLRLITLDQPNWRTRAQRFLKPVNVQTPGVSAWLMTREEAAGLLAELQRRTDFREHSSPHLLVANGQSTVVSAKRPRGYVRDLLMRPDVWPGFESQMGQLEEGYALEFSPLLSLDRRVIDASLKCEIDQLEKLSTVPMDVATVPSGRQRAKVEVPQTVHFRFHERFRWPADQVLVVGFGMVALPIPVDSKPNLAGIPLPLSASPPRGDLLVFIDARNAAAEAAARFAAPLLVERPR